jgi:uncharacterized membrane protein YbhN (UPF0104 family)
MTYDPDREYRQRLADRAAEDEAGKQKRWDDLAWSARLVGSVAAVVAASLTGLTVFFVVAGKHHPFWAAFAVVVIVAATIAYAIVESNFVAEYLEDRYFPLHEFWGFTALATFLWASVVGFALWGVLAIWTYGP